MAKMFYTVEEAAAKLGMTPDEVQGLGESGQLQEFRDRDRLMFKRDQVDLLAGDGGDDDEIGDEIKLADSGELEPMSLSSSGSGSAFNDSRAGSGSGDTGVSIFDPDESDADANADTLITGSPVGMPDLNDASASGSGLAQLSLEADDTSLGSDLLSDLGGSGAGASGTGMSAGSAAPAGDAGASGFGTGLGMGDSNAGSLFEGGSAEPDFGAPAAAGAAMVGGIAAEPYDGAWSGIAAGAALGAVLLLAATLGVTILGFAGEGAAELLGGVDSTMIMIIAGGGMAVVGLFAAVGWFMLRKG